MTQQHETPVNITSARTSRSDDISRRQFKYLIGMGIRTLCFVLAIVVSGPARWVLIAAAVFLPYFAVVMANVSGSRESAGPARFESEDLPQIAPPSGPTGTSHDTRPAA